MKEENIESFKERMLGIMQAHIGKDDPSHDMEHIRRVTNLALAISATEGGDPEILIPAAALHDAVVFPKNDPRSKESTTLSAEFARKELEKLVSNGDFPREKIPLVVKCILECSYSKGLDPTSLESAILQDADRLEATGAIAIMRTFSSGGAMQRPLYNPDDPFCEGGVPEGVRASLDLFYQRLFKVSAAMNTATARKMAVERHEFLKAFESQVRLELDQAGVYRKFGTKKPLTLFP